MKSPDAGRTPDTRWIVLGISKDEHDPKDDETTLELTINGVHGAENVMGEQHTEVGAEQFTRVDGIMTPFELEMAG